MPLIILLSFGSSNYFEHKKSKLMLFQSGGKGIPHVYTDTRSLVCLSASILQVIRFSNQGDNQIWTGDQVLQTHAWLAMCVVHTK